MRTGRYRSGADRCKGQGCLLSIRANGRAGTLPAPSRGHAQELKGAEAPLEAVPTLLITSLWYFT